MSFQSPLLLLTLLAVPLLLLGFRAAQRRRMRYALVYPNVDVLAAVVKRERSRLRHLPTVLAVLALALICTATARPQVTVEGRRDEGTVVLLVDVSRSMIARDVKPSRLGAARAAIKEFLRQLPDGFSVGIVAFSTTPSLASPVTRDRAVTRGAVDYLQPELGTAIGDGLAEAVRVGREAARRLQAGDARGRRPPVSILLLSDGAQRNGILLPEQGAQRAKAAGIPVYTIALGTSNAVVSTSFGGIERQVPVPPDPATLRRIATITNGAFFPAPSTQALRSAYGKIRARVATEPRKVETTAVFLAASAGLLVGAGALSVLWSSRLP